MLNTNYNIYTLIIHDFFVIPLKLRKENRFCLWKYEPSITFKGKLLKKPYGINSRNQIIPSLKNSKYWFNLDKLKELSFKSQQEYGLGLVLNDSSYVIIDLDKCISNENDKLILSKEVKRILDLFPDAYIEISPSNTGIHIIFQGQWFSSCNKANQYIHKDLKQGTVEVYSGNDCRYITLTGKSIYNSIINQDLPYYSYKSKSLQEIYNVFFSIKKLNNAPQELTKNSLNQPNNGTLNLSKKYLLIRSKILNSNLCIKYSNFCQKHNPGNKYKSISEADWSYFYLVNSFLNLLRSYQEKYFLLKYFYQKDRPDRLKKNREDYIKITIEKILNLDIISTQKNNLNKSNNNCNSVKYSKYIDNDNKNIERFDKSSILKLCNNMNIFYLIKPQKVFSRQIYSGSKNNYIKFIIPEPLTSIDLDHFSEILYQFHQKKFNILENEFSWLSEKYTINLNISLIARRLNKSDGGSFRSSLIRSLDKLSLVKMSFEKQIVKSGLVHKGVKDLMNYESFFTNDLILNKKYKKIIIEINFLTFHIMQNSNCHYSLLNIEHRNKLPNSQLRLLYHYICLKTIPGSNFFIDITISELLETCWPNTDNLSTKRTRKKHLIFLAKNLQEYSIYLSDMSFIFSEFSDNINFSNDILFKVKRMKVNI